MNIEKKTLEIRLYKNATMYNSNHDRNYKVKKYAEIDHSLFVGCSINVKSFNIFFERRWNYG